jgi:hypothetical protein
LPEFDVTVVTIRCGTHTVRVDAANSIAARNAIEAECRANLCDCSAEWCTDDVQSEVVAVRNVVNAHDEDASGGDDSPVHADTPTPSWPKQHSNRGQTG